MGVTFTSSAAESAPDGIEQITIIGSAAAVSKLPGSGAYINKETLDAYAVTDIQRILSSTAGVYFVEEDGYGLRPNIGMRGSSSDRSEKITVMEDGVLLMQVRLHIIFLLLAACKQLKYLKADLLSSMAHVPVAVL
jgi:Fe(3+) dicitrate transport protein